MPNVRIREEVMALIGYQANKDSGTIEEATERLIIQGYNRLRSLDKWRRKEKRAKKATKPTTKKAAKTSSIKAAA